MDQAVRPEVRDGYIAVDVEGDEGDEDFLRSAVLLGKMLKRRDAYKELDHGQLDDPVNELAFDVMDGDELGEEEGEEEEDEYFLLDDEDQLFTVDSLRFSNGVFSHDHLVTSTKLVPWATYIKDLESLFGLLEVGPWLSTARTRLQSMEEKFDLYSLLNGHLEEQADPNRKGGGVYSPAVKVDCNVNLSTCMTAQTLLAAIREAAQSPAPVWTRFVDGREQELNLGELFKEMGVDARRLTVEGLGLHPPRRKQFQRFDIMDPELNRGGKTAARVLQLFLHPMSEQGGEEGSDDDMFADREFGGNTINGRLTQPGRWLGEMTRKIMDRRTEPGTGRLTHSIVTEYKMAITGAIKDEWATLARWMNETGLMAQSTNRWIICIPRIAAHRSHMFTDVPDATNATQLFNIFSPLFKATLDPTGDNAALAEFLRHVGGFTVVSDEAARKRNFDAVHRTPDRMPWTEEPDDYYVMYYLWCNIANLNALRRRRGLNTFQFRPTCSPTTPHWDQLVASFFLADSINHGTKVEESWVMQYLFLFAEIGIIMSPLSNNGMNTPYFENPFVNFFRRGLKVTLATDDPLQYHHHSIDPLIEEYATAKKLFHLNPTDISEIARNSVLLSSFSDKMKQEFLGGLSWEENDESRSCVCQQRLQFRYECMRHEQALLNFILQQANTAECKKVEAANVALDNPDDHKPLPELMVISKFSNGPRALKQEHDKQFIDKRHAFARIFTGASDHSARLYRPAVELLHDALRLRAQLAVGETHHAPLDPASAEVQHTATELVACVSGTVPPALPGGSQVEPHHISPGRQGPAATKVSWSYNMFHGVFLIAKTGTAPDWPVNVPIFTRFRETIERVRAVVQNPAVAALAHARLDQLEHKFGLHLAMNIGRESGRLEEKQWNNRDYYTARKVDTNVQADAGVNARVLHNFFVSKVRHNGHDVVFEEHREPVTLKELIVDRMGISVDRLTVEELTSLLEQQPLLKKLFLSVENDMRGRYFAELAKLTLQNYKLDEYTFSENRLEITGRSQSEWEELAQWFDRYGMASPQNRWMLRIPRNYHRLHRDGKVENFSEFLNNIFEPLWEVSLNPGRHMKLHNLMSNVSGFDCIGDEQKVDLPLTDVQPHEWDTSNNPPFNYYMYYLWANITTLNAFRQTRGLPPFTFRPQCGEAGAVDHLIGGYLLADSLNHGVTLAKYPVLEYLFYIAHVGVTMSPLSNTKAAVAYLANPFPRFFRRGLNVTLSTNEPLKFHFTSEPLIEEFSLASKVWKLSANDLSEIARNSVLQSGFSPQWKREALGELYYLHSTLGNDVRRSRVSDMRVAYRFETYHAELNFLQDVLSAEGGAPARAGFGAGMHDADMSCGGGQTTKGGDTAPTRGATSPRNAGGGAVGRSFGTGGGGGLDDPAAEGGLAGRVVVLARAMRSPDEEAVEFERVMKKSAPAFRDVLEESLPDGDSRSSLAFLRAHVEDLQKQVAERRRELSDKVNEAFTIAKEVNALRQQTGPRAVQKRTLAAGVGVPDPIA